MPNYKYLGTSDYISFTTSDFTSKGVFDQVSVGFWGPNDVRVLSTAAFNLLVSLGYPFVFTTDPVGPGSPVIDPGGSPLPPSTSRYITTIGNGVATSFVVTHNLNFQWPSVVVIRNTPPYDVVLVTIEMTDANTLTIVTDAVPAANGLRVVVSA